MNANFEISQSDDRVLGRRRSVKKADTQTPGRRPLMRGRYFTLDQAAEAYPVFTRRLLRRLVEQRRIPFSRAGRLIVLAESDIELYLEANRFEPARRGADVSRASLLPRPPCDRA